MMYEDVYSEGNSENGQMHVHLYPWSSSEISACQSGGLVADTLKDTLETCVNEVSVGEYRIKRFKVEDWLYNYPKWGDIDDYSMVEILENFREYLTSKNGSGSDLYAKQGVHQLIHGGFTGCDEDAGGYAPAGAGADIKDGTAFSEGLVAWSPVCDNYEGLSKNAAIQECLHNFIDHDIQSVKDMIGSSDNRSHDEHTLGKTYDYYYYPVQITPMLTYHWDDKADNTGECQGDTSKMPTAYDQQLTSCTKDAVNITAYYRG